MSSLSNSFLFLSCPFSVPKFELEFSYPTPIFIRLLSDSELARARVFSPFELMIDSSKLCTPIMPLEKLPFLCLLCYLTFIRSSSCFILRISFLNLTLAFNLLMKALHLTIDIMRRNFLLTMILAFSLLISLYFA